MARQPEVVAPGGVLTSRDAPAFDVHLDVFTGPFDLLLGLVARHRLDLSDVALAEVTDEFIAHVRRLSGSEPPSPPAPAGGARTEPRTGAGPHGASTTLGQLSGFLLVAATLLDLKASRLLPSTTEDDPEDVTLLEARDLLFARLLQHRAYADVAAEFRDLEATQALWVPRAAPLEEALVAAMPPLEWTTTPEALATIAAAVLAPRPAPVLVARDHLHAPAVDLSEQVYLVATWLARAGTLPFAELVDGVETPVVVGRFLAVLELYRRGRLDVHQSEPWDPLHVSWRPADDQPSSPDGHDSVRVTEPALSVGGGA